MCLERKKFTMKLARFFSLSLFGLILASCGGYQAEIERLDQEIERIRRESKEYEAELLQNALAVAKENNAPIIIDYAGPISVNSAGGVTFALYFLNSSDKTIKYVNLDLQAYNSVGDPQGGEIYSSSKRSVEFTGPTSPTEYAQTAWGELWYNSTITCTKILSLKITYMDGSSKSFNAQQVSNLLRPYKDYGGLNQKTENSCAV